jgi:hypothetical protein
VQHFISRLPARYWLALKRRERSLFGKQRDGDWKFSYGSSGTFGEKLPGRWIDRERAIAVWRMLESVHQRVTTHRLDDWYDIHATP